MVIVTGAARGKDNIYLELETTKPAEGMVKANIEVKEKEKVINFEIKFEVKMERQQKGNWRSKWKI